MLNLLSQGPFAWYSCPVSKHRVLNWRSTALPEQDQRNAVARFLDARDMKAEALEIAIDPDYRFDLAGAIWLIPSVPDQAFPHTCTCPSADATCLWVAPLLAFPARFRVQNWKVLTSMQTLWVRRAPKSFFACGCSACLWPAGHTLLP